MMSYLFELVLLLYSLVMKLEIGVGFRECGQYSFRPRVTDSDVVYLDIKPPEVKVDNPWIVADAQYLPFRDGVFEEVYASHLIEHLSDPALFLKECYRVLRYGGILRIWCPNVFSKNMYRDPSHIFRPNPYLLKKLLTRVGFQAHFDCPSVGSLFPIPFRVLFRYLYLFLADEIRVIAWKG